MCGIAGFVGPGSPADLKRMTDRIAHRGPDGEGHYHDPENALFLGHRRLAIIDIDGGRQPMWDTSGMIAVIYNGEIYNHLELRKQLIDAGRRFVSDHSDTEVLIHGWREWGEALPERLNGMFAFTIWDAEQRCLFLARDHMGEKPLYWGRRNDLFVFGSDLGVFDAHPDFPTETDTLALKKYLAHQFFPGETTLYRNVRKLKPGASLLYRLRSGAASVDAYWRFRIEPAETPPSLDEAAEEVAALLRTAVKRRLMSDVPLGVFLSGGVDSSAITALMRDIDPDGAIKSFAIGFREPSYDESAHARRMAAAAGTDHFEQILDLAGLRELIGPTLSAMDEPLGDASLIPAHLLSRFTREHVTVALSGDAGDELFAGYDTFSALKSARLYRAAVPEFLHRAVTRLADLIPRSSVNMSLDFKVRRALKGVAHKAELWNPCWIGPADAGELEELFYEPVSTEELYSEALAVWREDPGKSLIDKSLEFYTTLYLPDDILTKSDRASMMCGLETRAVFADIDLVNYVRRLPASHKFHNGERKRVLKRALRRVLPDWVADRKKKGFGMPVADWLKELPIPSDAPLAIDSTWLKGRIENHQAGKADHRLLLWSWLALTNMKEFQSSRVLPDQGPSECHGP